MHFHNFAIIFPCVALHSNKYEFPSPKDGMCQFWLKLAEWFRRRESLNFVNVFLLFYFYLPLERDIAPYLKNRGSPLSQKSFVPRFGWNWPSCSGEDLKIRPCIFAILVLSPLYLNKLGFPLFKDVSNQVWLKMAQ